MITKQLLSNDFFQIPSLRTAGTYIEIFKHTAHSRSQDPHFEPHKSMSFTNRTEENRLPAKKTERKCMLAYFSYY